MSLALFLLWLGCNVCLRLAATVRESLLAHAEFYCFRPVLCLTIINIVINLYYGGD